MAEVISLVQRASARRRAQEQAATETCVRILQHNLQLALQRFATASPEERPVRARQLRQLSELLEYVTQCG